MNIGIDIRCLLKKNRSGVANYAFNIVKNILATDRENQYWLFSNSLKSAQEIIPEFNYPNVKIRHFRFPNKILNGFLKFFKFPKIDKLLGDKQTKIDLFFIPNLNFINLSSDCKKVVTVHDLSFFLFPQFYSRKERLLVNPKKLYQQADKLIAVSVNTKNDLIKLCQIPAEKITVIYPGLEQKNIDEVKINELLKEVEPPIGGSTSWLKINEIKEKYRLPDNFILYFGTLEPRKNVEGLIQAFEIIRTKYHLDYKLVIAGPLGWLYKSIYKTAHKISSLGDIKLISSYIPEEDKPYFYRLAKLVVYPSYYEGFGFPPLEAMSQGAPVVTSLNSSLGEVAGNAALLVDPYNINELAEAINQVLIDEKLRNNLIAKGYEQVKKFNWQTCARETLDVLTR